MARNLARNTAQNAAPNAGRGIARPGTRTRTGAPNAAPDFDIVISGAGIAGMVAAAGLARAGRSVCLLDPAPPPKEESADGSDLRSTAYLMPSWQMLGRLGLTDALARHAVPLKALRIVDTEGDPPRPRDSRLFTPEALGLAQFGVNLPNWLTRRELGRVLADLPGLEMRLGTGFASRFAREAGMRVTTTDGEVLTCRLLVGADGRDSPVRAAAGIGARTTRYGQKALAFAVTHDVPHDGVSTESYAPGGACTLVPLPDRDGRAASAVVWMSDGPEAVRLAALAPAELAEALDRRSCGILGRPEIASPVRLWPVVTQLADRLTARRTALVAEAAHVLPPIGAQGLNTSLADIAALLEAVDGAADPGDAAVPDRFARLRRRDLVLRAAAIDLFNRVCRADSGPARGARHVGLKAVHDIAPLRAAVMRAGMGRETVSDR